jgi:hypothetical protein
MQINNKVRRQKVQRQSHSAAGGVTQLFLTGTLALCCFLGVSSQGGHFHYGLSAAQARSRFGNLTQDDTKRVLQAHQAGLSGDITQIQAAIDLLREPVHPVKHETALLSAGLFWLLAATHSQEPFGLLVPPDAKRLVSVRDMGCHRDPKAVPDLIAVLALDI